MIKRFLMNAQFHILPNLLSIDFIVLKKHHLKIQSILFINHLPFFSRLRTRLERVDKNFLISSFLFEIF